jgi:penicillin amidase
VRPRRLARRLLLGAAALVVAAVGTGAFLAWGSLPQLEGSLAVPGLNAPVEIVRDEWGVPRIRAESAEEAHLGLGFAHAQDRLWQMEMHRRVAQGRLAELVGAAALPVDRLMRTLGLYRHAQASIGHLPPQARRQLEAYAAGVNGFLATRRWPLPPEFQLLRHAPEPWRIEDSLVFTRLMALDLGGNWRGELLRARLAQRMTAEQMADLFPDQPADTPVTIASLRRMLAGLDLDALDGALPAAPPSGLGSNVWAVDGSRTASGGPLLANDPHLGLQAPGLWYLAGLEAPGLSVIGGTMPSMPIVVAGRNDALAWGLTNTGPDTQDLFVERIDPADPQRYLTPDGSAPIIVREELIGVRGHEPERLVVRETRHGPVISDLGGGGGIAGEGRMLALAWTALADDDVTLAAGLRLATAADGAALDAALLPFASPQQNVAWATRDGRIGLVAPGRVPIRRSGDGRLPVPGWDGKADWIGAIPFALLPRIEDPPSGQVVNANNRLVGPDYPYLIAVEWDPALRARRIEAMLGGAHGLDLGRFAAMQNDLRSTLADDFLPFLLEAAATGDAGADLMEALGAWDRRMLADRPEPLAFAAWYEALAEAVYADELGPLFADYRGLRPDFMRRVLQRRQIWCDDIGTAAIESCDERIVLAWREAIQRLRAQRGQDWRAWRWGEAHRTVMRHRLTERLPALGALFRIELPGDGDGSTLDVGHYRGGGGIDAFVSSTGPSYRMLVDLADPEASLFVAATGQSGHPLSPHWRDLTALWAQGAYVPMRRASGPGTSRRLLLHAPDAL